MKNKFIIIGVIIFLLLIILAAANPFYVLYEGQQAVITQFGQPVGAPITEAGLHTKVPFIQKVNYFEKRILEWDGFPDQIPTKDKKYIYVDTTARWRIVDPLKFFKSLNDERGAHGILDDIIDSAVRKSVNTHDLISIVRSTNNLIDRLRETKKEESFLDDTQLEPVTIGRDAIRDEIMVSAKELASYGIEVIDVRIKKVNYIEDVRKKAYERMTAERKRAAEQYRSEGRGVRAEVEGRTEKELKKITSEAYRQAQEVKGRADAQATKIYAQAYSQDPEFYSFIKTLETYQNTIDSGTTIILTTDGEYYKYLKDASPQAK